MAQVPKIDSPCPLGIDEQRRLDGHCGRCDKHVHALDAMSDGERQALLRSAEGSICVSYRTPHRSVSRRGAGFGIAIAATLVSGGAFAADPPSLLPAAASEQATPVSAASPLLEPAPVQNCEEEDPGLEFITVGGVSDPQDAHWVDDSDLPELPMREAAALDDAMAAIDRADAVDRKGNPVSTR